MILLARIFLRSRLGFLLGWMFPLITLLAISPTALHSANPHPEEVAALGQALSLNLGTRVMYGITPLPLTYATWVIWELWIWLVLLGGVMIMLLAVRITRAAEEDGIIELIRATGMSRNTPVAAAILTVLATSAAFGALCAFALVAQLPKLDEFELMPSVLSGCGIALALATYGAIALLASQVSPTARGARGLSLSVLALT